MRRLKYLEKRVLSFRDYDASFDLAEISALKAALSFFGVQFPDDDGDEEGKGNRA